MRCYGCDAVTSVVSIKRLGRVVAGFLVAIGTPMRSVARRLPSFAFTLWQSLAAR
jgi:hypothetical protein